MKVTRATIDAIVMMVFLEDFVIKIVEVSFTLLDENIQ